MKYYRVDDLQDCNFMGDTYEEPMTLNALRARFWSLDDSRTVHYKDFSKEFIEDNWEVKLLSC